MSIYAQIAAVLIALIVAAGGGVRVGLKLKQGEWDAAKVAGKESQDRALTVAADRIAAMIPAQAMNTEKVTHEVKTNTVYRDCVVPAAGLRLLNDSITGAATEPAGGDGVQAPTEKP